jgi:hypothetical protein
LRSGGHDVFVASGDPVTCATILGREWNRAILAAPVPPLRPDLMMKPPREGGFSDKLFTQGFNSPVVLSALAAAWRALIEVLAPAAVISIGAPVLALAARGRNRLIVAASGESLPPLELPDWPRLHANIAPAQSNDKLLLHANIAAQSVSAAPVTCPTDILRGDATIVYGLPQIDPYVALRSHAPIGPLLPLPAPCVPAGKPAMIGILDVHHPAIEALVLALTDFGKTPVHLHIRGMTTPMFNFLAQVPGVVLHPDIGTALETAPHATFLLHHANPRVAAIGIGLGIPQSLLPFNIEQNAVADMLQRFNAGYRLEAGTDPAPIADALRRLFRNLDQVQNAQHIARQLGLQPPAPAMDRLVATVESLLA